MMEGELGDTALVMTMHDPEGRLRPGLDAVGERLTAYDGVYAVATDSTDASLIAEVRRRGVEVAIGPVRVPGTGQPHRQRLPQKSRPHRVAHDRQIG